MSDHEIIQLLDWITRRRMRPSLQNGYWYHPTDQSRLNINSSELLSRYKEHVATMGEGWPNSKILKR